MDKGRGVLIHIWLVIPHVIFTVKNFFTAPEGPKFTAAHGVGDHVDADPKAQIPGAVFNSSFFKLTAGDFLRSGPPVFPEELKEF